MLIIGLDGLSWLIITGNLQLLKSVLGMLGNVRCVG